MTIKQIKQWFETAVPNPDAKTLAVQVGVHLEEVAEMLQAFGEGSTYHVLDYLADAYKTGWRWIGSDVDDVELLDSLCDQIVTAIGVAHMKGYDIEGALQEVALSNDSKFVDGRPLFNEHGKIQKGPNYSKPNLKPFIGK